MSLQPRPRTESYRSWSRSGISALTPVHDARIVSWGGTMGQRWNATIKSAGTSVPEGTVVLAVRLNEHGQRNVVLVEAYEGDRTNFASFPRLALTLGATEIQVCAAGGTMVERSRIARELARHARADRATLLARPLVVAGAFNRSAIMATACAAAKARQVITGETWGACLSVALTGTWALARAARLAAAHKAGPMAADLIRSPAVRLLHAQQDHAICLRLAASYRHRIAAGETDQREAHAWALGLTRRWRLVATELSRPRAPPT